MFLFIVLLLIYFGNGGCKNDTASINKNITSGSELAEVHCGRCHEKPEPTDLLKHSWENSVLPEMSYYLGLKSSSDKMFNMAEDEYGVLAESKLFPDKPLVTAAQWDSIFQYYVSHAPDSINTTAYENSNISNENEKEDIINTLSNHKGSVSLVKVSPDNEQYYIASEEENTLEVYNSSLKKLNEVHSSSPISDIAFDDEKKYLLQIGSINPSDRKQGKLSLWDKNNEIKDLIVGLKRPVNLLQADMNHDGTEDFVICNYGNLTGYISWYDGLNFVEHKISDNAGPRLSEYLDLDNDGQKELVVLFCQGNEHISVFDEKNHFTKENILLSFPPENGSSFIELKDVNGDYFLDILYTCGDNADLSLEIKNFHGFSIFLNDGKNHFKKSFFYQMPGCSKVIAEDIDKDGDLDFALISFFPKSLEYGFVMLRQISHFNFHASKPKNIEQGNWLVMDYDKKHNTFILGNYNRQYNIIGKQVEFLDIHY
jgi:WD40 repeat protein